jgi:hypothetical protein
MVFAPLAHGKIALGARLFQSRDREGAVASRRYGP